MAGYVMAPLLPFTALSIHTEIAEGGSCIVFQGTCNGAPAAVKLLHKFTDAPEMAEREAAMYQVGQGLLDRTTDCQLQLLYSQLAVQCRSTRQYMSVQLQTASQLQINMCCTVCFAACFGPGAGTPPGQLHPKAAGVWLHALGHGIHRH
jgi:hypothetical protein